MNYSLIKPYDIADGPGVRVSLFVSGCTNHCKGCFQPETWDFNYGHAFTEDTIKLLISYLKPDYITGLTILGGDPMEPSNQSAVNDLINRIKGELPGKTIWLYTGFTLEKLKETGSYCRTQYTDNILNHIDVLVDGPFIEEQKDISLKFKGSKNQRIINMKE